MKKLLTLSFLLIFISAGYSQNHDPNDNLNLFSISPQYVIINGFKLNYEKRFRESAHAIVASPIIFAGNIDNNTLLYSDYTNYELSGAGIELTHKIYTKETWDSNINWYQSYSLAYNYLAFQYDGFDWVPINPGSGNNLLALRDQKQQLSINQAVISTMVGAVLELDEKFYMDFYLGIGAKKSWAKDSSTDRIAEEDFKSGFLNYNFTGAILRAGFRVGMSF